MRQVYIILPRSDTGAQVVLEPKIRSWLLVMTNQSSTLFDVTKFNNSNYPIWKLKIHVILIKDSCAITIKGKDKKDKDLTNAQFDEKDKMTIANIFLALDDSVLFNVSNQITTKSLW